MLHPPYTITCCTWPRPVRQHNDLWASEPEWDAPLMPSLPQPHWMKIQDTICWTIDWCKLFDGGLKYWGQHRDRGEMRGFHVVFQIQIHDTGTLVFWDDDGSIISRNGEMIHTDRATHAMTRHEIEVKGGDCLTIAQWQNYGGWLWGAQPMVHGDRSTDLLVPYLDKVTENLRAPNGPAIKIFTHGGTPVRTILAIYSMVLNGYQPKDIYVFGEYQWSEHSHQLFAQFLPFARLIPTGDVLSRLRGLGDARLVELAKQHWLVMKTCVGVLYPPDEYCFMDDDLFILGSVDDALAAFRTYNLVYAPDGDYSHDYLTAWGWPKNSRASFSTGRLNAGLYWLRNLRDPRQLAAAIFHISPRREPTWQWEQSFLAIQYADEPSFQLPHQRYFYPYFDGLPGGILGYDYGQNPCGFASIHFGGLVEKPSDTEALLLIHAILNRHG